MSDHAFEGFAQPLEIGLAYGSLATVVIKTVAMDAIVPHRHELHKRSLGRFIWKNGRAERAAIVQIDLHEVMVHQLAQAGMHPITKSVRIRRELNDSDLVGNSLLVALYQC